VPTLADGFGLSSSPPEEDERQRGRGIEEGLSETPRKKGSQVLWGEVQKVKRYELNLDISRRNI
jgi:hypothetical protein